MFLLQNFRKTLIVFEIFAVNLDYLVVRMLDVVREHMAVVEVMVEDTEERIKWRRREKPKEEDVFRMLHCEYGCI